jgi:arylsulfatase A-like enzyme
MPADPSSQRPNVVLICVDQWRGDALSEAGHPVVRTPYLDRMARAGTRFANAYSSTPTCVPARVGLMTGLGQSRHRRLGYQDGIPFDFTTTMAGEFRRHGYQTKCVGKLHVYPERNRIGFDDVSLHDGYLHFARHRGRAVDTYDDYLLWLRNQPGQSATTDYFDNGVNCNSIVARPWDKAETLHPTTWTVTESVNWLNRRDPTCPFFLFVSFHRPHPPLDPPTWAFEQYLHAPQHRPPVGDWTRLLEPYRNDDDVEANVARYDEETLQRARAGYFGHMSHIDQQINRLVESLAEAGVGENTYVAFTADHGEMLGDHDMWRKGYPYEGSAHVPLLLQGPPGGRVRAGLVDHRLAELRDVMPTLLDCAGLPAPADIDGVSLLGGTADGRSADGGSADGRSYLHGEHTMFDQTLQWIVSDGAADGRGGWKYVWWSKTGTEQLFDLGTDPHELHDLAGARNPGRRAAAALKRHRNWLIECLDGRADGHVRDGRLVPGRPALTLLPPAAEQLSEA